MSEGTQRVVFHVPLPNHKRYKGLTTVKLGDRIFDIGAILEGVCTVKSIPITINIGGRDIEIGTIDEMHTVYSAEKDVTNLFCCGTINFSLGVEVSDSDPDDTRIVNKITFKNLSLEVR